MTLKSTGQPESVGTLPKPRSSSKQRLTRLPWPVRLCLPAFLVLVIPGCTEITLQPATHQSDAETAIVDQLKSIPTATLADAVDGIVGRRGFMNYDMRPVSLKHRMVGRAKTALFGPSGELTKEKNLGPAHAVQIIDESGPGDILVVVTGDLNVTGLGGLMATTASVRGMEGVVVDGAVRDVTEIEALGLSVFSRSISPATMLGRSTSLIRDVPIVCGGITVAPGDYIVGDRDGVVCIPAAQIQGVLIRALEMEAAEKKMQPMIREIKSLQKVVEQFKRI